MLKPPYRCSPLEDPRGFRVALRAWFEKHGRDHPWRRTRDPYEVLVSEVMLQQTQIATVLGKGYYTRFLEVFPDVRSLAAADDRRLLKAWEGLGYYRRARMLRETASAVIERHGGTFPEDVDSLMALPGIGRYTAGALRAFAFGLPAVLVDGNVSRVIARLMDYGEPVYSPAGQRQVWTWAEALADAKQPRVHHSALMELGQTYCRPGVPDCLSCPVARFCRSSEPAKLPAKKRKTAVTLLTEHAIWLRDRKGRILLHRESGSRRTGLWKLPLRAPEETRRLPLVAEHVYAITRYRVTLKVHDAGTATSALAMHDGDAWIAVEDLPALPLAAPFKRAIAKLIEDF